MIDYQLQPNTRRCVVTGRELRPGDRFFTALLEDGDRLVRHDYSQEAWQGPPQGAFGFWTGKVQTPDKNDKPRFDDDLLEECFHRLEAQSEPSQVKFRYVVALLLVRRRRFKLEKTVETDGVELLEICCGRTGERFQVANPGLSEDEMSQVQDEVFRVLGWN